MSYFAKLEHKYKEVPLDGAIETIPFLDATRDSLLPIFDILGSTSFAPLKSDVNGNITKLRKRYNTNPSQYGTLTDMVLEEVEKGTTKSKNSATDALLWLTRGLYFMSQLVYNLVREDDLSKSVAIAYEKSLKPYHSWIVHKVVSLAVAAVPYKHTLMEKLGNGVDEDTLDKDIREFEQLLTSQIEVIKQLYKDKGLIDIHV